MDNIKNTFYWFDYETFGANSRTDRPAQFGGLRTDDQLNPVGDELLLYCQTADDYLPDPRASLITGITPLTCLDEGIPEAEFAQEINRKMSVPGTISIGYNNIGFDDEITRFLFWRNLIPPYAREWGEGRRRLDLYTLVKAVFAFKPDTLHWPRKSDGSFSLKLEDLTKINGITHSHAHDAQSDAKATMALARLIKSRQPKLWDYFVQTLQGSKLKEIFNSRSPLLYVDPFQSQDKRFLTVLLPLVPFAANQKEWLCWDLSKDPKEINLETISEQDLKERLFVSRERRLEGVEPLPLKKVALNKLPFVVNALPYLKREEFQKLTGLTPDLVNQRSSQLLCKDLRFLDNVLSIIRNHLGNAPHGEQEIESALYGGFLSEHDTNELSRLRALPPEDLQEAAERTEFNKKDLDNLVFRYRARNYPEYLYDSDESNKWYNYRLECLVDGRWGRRTFKEYFAILDELEASHPDLQELLEDLRMYGENLEQDLESEE